MYYALSFMAPLESHSRNISFLNSTLRYGSRSIFFNPVDDEVTAGTLKNNYNFPKSTNRNARPGIYGKFAIEFPSLLKDCRARFYARQIK